MYDSVSQLWVPLPKFRPLTGNLAAAFVVRLVPQNSQRIGPTEWMIVWQVFFRAEIRLGQSSGKNRSGPKFYTVCNRQPNAVLTLKEPMATKGRKDEMGHLIPFLKCFELRNAVINPVHRSGWQSFWNNPKWFGRHEDWKLNRMFAKKPQVSAAEAGAISTSVFSEIPSVQEDIGVLLLDIVN